VKGAVLVVDDDRAMCEALEAALVAHDLDVEWVTSGREALERLERTDPDCLITDVHMPVMDGLELCRRVAARREDLPVVVITAFGSMDTAVGAIRAGAYDFITKPFDVPALILVVERAIRHRRLSTEVRRLRRLVEQRHDFGELIGTSRPIERLRRFLDRIVDSDVSVLVTGESGTGKEVVARLLHDRGPRHDGPFIAVNCAAMPETLLENELFGHVRGSFTGAEVDREGLFVQANGGTILLDEIGELPLPLQPKLLRALQERRARPVGGDREVAFDVRVIATTNRALETAIDEGRFRQDLYFRVNVVNVETPPLRSRGGDVLLLAQHFLAQAAEASGKAVRGLAPPAAERLLAYTWPGNVRELQNCMERAVALARFDDVTVDDLPEAVRTYAGSHVLVAGMDPSELAPLEEVERRYVLRVLEAAGGNKALAARILGVGRKTLYRKLDRWSVREAVTGRNDTL
jgi:DNA-binding NtrC family response regulator